MNTLVIDDARLAYLDTGPRAAGPTLLLVHGFPLTHAMWLPLIEALGDACRVLAPDLRGYGGSSLGSAEVTLARYADDLAALLEQVNPAAPVVYVGFSMGGYIAWPFLERHGERIAGLVLADTRTAADTEPARAARLKMAQKVGEWGSRRVAEMMRPNLFATGTAAEVIDPMVEAIAETDPCAIAASQSAMAARPDVTARLGEVTLPTQIVVGEEDAISPPEEMHRIASAIPRGQFAAIARAGHMAPVERPEACADLLRSFLASLV